MRVAIVGGGVLGASTALHLASAGASVVLVDAGLEGRATAAGAGIVCPWVSGADEAFYQLYAGGARYYGALLALLAERGEQDLGYARVGGLCVSDNADELSALAAFVQARVADAPEAGDVRLLTPTEAHTLFPALRAGLGGVLVTGGARVDGRRLTAAMLRAAQSLGTALREGKAELALSDARVVGVRVAGEVMRADSVIVTAGAWAPILLQPLGVTLPVMPQRGQIMHLRLPGIDTAAWPIVLPQSDHYLLAFEDSRVVVGATRESGVGFDYRVTAAGQAEVLTEALRIAPGLGSATVLETRVGFRPASADGLPVLGRIDGLDGVLIGNGLGAAGLTIGPLAGALLADLALGREPALDLRAFHPGRRVGARLHGSVR